MPRNGDNERTPLLSNHTSNFWAFGQERRRDDYHAQFCQMVGIPPSDLPPNEDPPAIGKKTLYGRALRAKSQQSVTYTFTAAISNTLLLSQVVLGAAVTGLGASASSHILITLFGALNTIIAGVVAYLKSRGQPMRARMYRDDLERVVDEIENSEVMWLGISKGVHGYDDINIDEQVTVRSEVARLTRLYDRAVRTNTVNNPDMYMAGSQNDSNLALKARVGAPAGPVPVIAAPNVPTSTIPPVANGSAAVAAPAAPIAPIVDPDESPASAPLKPPTPPPPPPSKEEPKSEATKEEPKTEPPKSDPPKADSPKTDLPSADSSKADPPKQAGPQKAPAELTEKEAKPPVETSAPNPPPAQASGLASVLLDEDASPACAPTNALSGKSRKSREDL